MSVRLSGLASHEYWLLAVLLTCAAFVSYGDAFAARLSQPAYLVGIFAWLFVAILGSALSVVRHADKLAGRLGEPFGTLILTLSVTVIEVASITAIMLHGENNPTLTRDTLFAVVMIILNGMVGLALLVGGLRHREQHYNLQGANPYLGVILPLIAFSLLLPDFTQTTPGPTLSIEQSAFIAIGAPRAITVPLPGDPPIVDAQFSATGRKVEQDSSDSAEESKPPCRRSTTVYPLRFTFSCGLLIQSHHMPLTRHPLGAPSLRFLKPAARTSDPRAEA